MPTSKLENKLSEVGCARVQVTLLESMIFSSCLNSRNLASSKGFVKISARCMSVDVVELDLPSPNVIPDEVILNLNMLRLEVLHRVERNLDGTLIITPKRHYVTNDTVLL